MTWTDEDLNSFVENISERGLNYTVASLQVMISNPSGDPRVIPILEGFCADKRIARITIPYYYGEIAYLAAFALCAVKHKCNMDGKIRIATVIPLSVSGVHKLEERYPEAFPPGISDMVAVQTLADLGKLPQMVLELDPTRDSTKHILPEWLELRQYGFDTEVEQLISKGRWRNEQ